MGQKKWARVVTLELSLTRLAEELSLLAWGEDRTLCVVNILVAI